MTPTNLIEETPARSERAPRIVGTPAAVALISQLKQQHGPVMFHQSGGCCDGSAPSCFRLGEFRVSAQDVHLGDIDGTPFYVGASQYKYLADTPLTLDIVPVEPSPEQRSHRLPAWEIVLFFIATRASFNSISTKGQVLKD
jgi:uncharacterized protein (DUF779 family)